MPKLLIASRVGGRNLMFIHQVWATRGRRPFPVAGNGLFFRRVSIAHCVS